jgi:hypothetical protein
MIKRYNIEYLTPSRVKGTMIEMEVDHSLNEDIEQKAKKLLSYGTTFSPDEFIILNYKISENS